MDKLKTLTEEITRHNAEITRLSNDIFNIAREAFFEAHPTVYGFGWNQYAPYFNDGEACTFSVNEIVLFLTEEDYEDDTSCHEGSDVPDATEYVLAIGIINHGKPNPSSWRDTNYYKGVIERVKMLENEFPNLPQILEDFGTVKTALAQVPETMYISVFDEDCAVIMTKDGHETKDFSHD